jgi:hypothetical protein
MNRLVAFFWSRLDAIFPISLLSGSIAYFAIEGLSGTTNWLVLAWLFGGAAWTLLFEVALVQTGRIRFVGPEAPRVLQGIPVGARLDVLEDQVARLARVVRDQRPRVAPVDLTQALADIEAVQ